MKEILVVDDHNSTHELLRDICRDWSNTATLVTAEDESEAAGILQRGSVMLSIFDLSSGYGLNRENLAKLTYRFPHIPCIAIVDKKQHLKNKVFELGASACLYAPPSAAALKLQAYRLLEETIIGTTQGINVHSLLQSMEQDQITCTLFVRTRKKTGVIYIEEGLPAAAEFRGFTGEDAVYAILGWENTAIEMRYYNCQRPRDIHKPLLALIIEAFRLKDEQADTQEKEKQAAQARIAMESAPKKQQDISFEMGAKGVVSLGGMSSCAGQSAWPRTPLPL